MKASFVLLTMGERPAELSRAVASCAAQQDVEAEILVVGNGIEIEPPPPARSVALADNVGVPGGRNAGVEHTTGEVVFFLDDDGSFPDPTLAARTLAMFERDPRLGIVGFRVEVPGGARHQRRHVPRLRAADPTRSSEVTTFLGGACAIRREVFESAGLYPGEFFFGHEETDLAWRALDRGYRIHYAGDLVMRHPAAPPSRHPTHFRLTARNRVLLARRRLPWILAAIYLANWFVLDLARAPDHAARLELLRGFGQGIRVPAGERDPMRWTTVWRLARLGRPPII